MPIRNAYRLRWQPTGLSDSLDGNNAFPGAMAVLTNLIPDPTTPGSWVCRPAAITKTTFGSFSTPGFISGLLVVGNIAYGMIASALHAGKDEPFAYNISTDTFLTVTGILNANTPTSPVTTGDWVPPILAQVGTRIMVCHPGFAGGAIKVGWFDVSGLTTNGTTGDTHTNTVITNLSTNPVALGWRPGMTIISAPADIPVGTTIVSMTATTVTLSAATTATNPGVTIAVTGGTAVSPQWGAGDLNANNLPSTPLGVAQFSGRAYFACGLDGIVYSDSLNPTNRTNASQALTTNDGLSVTAVGPLMLSSPLVGGIVQSLIAFEGIAKMQQIAGDPATTNLTMNALTVATGTLAPLSITPTSKGLAFISPEGMRFIDFGGNVSDPIGHIGVGVSAPFVYAQFPSRICAAANADQLRVTVKRGDLADNPTQEFWYDLTQRMWSGPHTFPASLIDVWGSTFLLSATGVDNTLWVSDALTSSTSSYIENDVQLGIVYQPTLLPDDQEMEMIAVLESTVTIAVSTSTVTATALDDQGLVLDSVTFAAVTGGSLWDVFLWDVGVWDGSPATYRQRQIGWTQTLVAKQLTIRISADAANSFRIGNLSLRYQRLGYQLQVA